MTPLATRWVYVDRINTEFWFKTEPHHVPTMEVMIVRDDDGKLWQLALRYRIKLHDRFNTELFPKPHGKRWVFAEDRERVGIFKRRTTKKFLKEQGIV